MRGGALAAFAAAVIGLGGCTAGPPPAPAPPGETIAGPSAEARSGLTRLPQVVLTADLSETPSPWELVARIPYGQSEAELGLTFERTERTRGGVFVGPASFAVGRDGSIWVADRVKARIARFSRSGAHLGELRGFFYERGKPALHDLAVSGDGLHAMEDWPELPVRTIRSAPDLATLGEQVPVRDEGRDLAVLLLYPADRGVIGLLGGYADPVGSGPHGFAALRVPGDSQAEFLPGIPVGPDRWIDLAAAGDQVFELTYRTGSARSVQPVRVKVVTALGPDGRELPAFVGPGIEAALGDAVGMIVGFSAQDGDRPVGGTWYLQIGASGAPLVWERLPQEHRHGEQQRRRLVTGLDGHVYLMTASKDAALIHRRP